MAEPAGRPSPPETTTAEAAYIIRRSRPSDARQFVRLYRSVADERRFIRTERVTRGPLYYRKQLAKGWEADECSLVAVGTADGALIGHIGVAREEHPAVRHVASISMMVDADWRRRGVGAALMREGIRWARDVGVEKLALSVYPDNEPARALYRRLGFVEEGRLTGHSKKAIGYRDEIVMGLWLVPQPPGGPS
ncbi:MAG: N-acetyltransferase family protein [Actinomycetota bacterium]